MSDLPLYGLTLWPVSLRDLPRANLSRQYHKPAHNPHLLYPCAYTQQPARPDSVRVYRVLGKVLGNYFNKTLDTLVSTPQTLP
jgi:hypothetical protein